MEIEYCPHRDNTASLQRWLCDAARAGDEAARADRVIALSDGRVAIDENSRDALSDVERLRSLGLDAPLPARIAYGLKRRGIYTGDVPVTAERLAEVLCAIK